MRVHVLRHVAFEGAGSIGDWARERGHALTESFAFTEEFPPVADRGLLVVMGGPMAADDDIRNPWLAAERRYVFEAVEQSNVVLGVCLGAQILATALGGEVRRNPEREIGWYPVTLTEAGSRSPVFSAWPDQAIVGHWHGDTFALPKELTPMLSSDACVNQAFEFEGRVVGLQCHLEWREEDLKALVAACGDELAEDAPHVMSAENILEQTGRFSEGCRRLLWGVLDRMTALR